MLFLVSGTADLSGYNKSVCINTEPKIQFQLILSTAPMKENAFFVF